MAGPGKVICLSIPYFLTASLLHAQMPDFRNTEIPARDDPTWVIPIDVNGDDLLDLVVSNTVLYDENLTVFLRDPEGGYTISEDIPIPGDGVYEFASGDFDGDGKLDLIVPCFQTDNVFLFRGDGEGGFAEPEEFWAGPDPNPVIVGDLNNDDFPDLVISSWATGYLNIMLGGGDGTFDGPFSYFVRGGPNYSTIGDFNEDGLPDIAVANATYNDVALLLGTGGGSFVNGGTFDVLYDAYTLSTGDFNGDGHLDLACGTHHSLSVLLGDGNASFERVQDFITVSQYKWVRVADFNVDGFDDIAICIKGLSVVVIFPGNGTGLFGQNLSVLSTGNTPRSLFVADVNNDGDLDLLSASEGDDDIVIHGNLLDEIVKMNVYSEAILVEESNVTVIMDFSVHNLSEAAIDCDMWLTASVGDMPEALVPLDNMSWPANPLSLQLAPEEVRGVLTVGVSLPSSPAGMYHLRLRLGEYPGRLYSIRNIMAPTLLISEGD